MLLKKGILPVVLIALLGCEEKTASYSGKTETVAQPTPIIFDRPKSYSARGIDNSWPTLADNNIAVDSENLPAKNYYIIFDASGSMHETTCGEGQRKITVAKDAVVNFIKQIPASANIGIAGFDGRGVKEYLSLLNSTKDLAFTAIQSFKPSGGTPLNSAISLGYQSLQKQAERQLGYGEYHLVVVTDGQASRGENPQPIVEKITSNSPITIHTIGFCIGAQHSLNQEGKVFYKAASDKKSLSEGLESVLAESEDFSLSNFSQ